MWGPDRPASEVLTALAIRIQPDRSRCDSAIPAGAILDLERHGHLDESVAACVRPCAAAVEEAAPAGVVGNEHTVATDLTETIARDGQLPGPGRQRAFGRT